METIIVLAILGIVVGTAGWSFYRNITGGNGNCSCCVNCKTCNSKNILRLDKK
ncbi:MAG: FeoB-associated Cys-rich membrane protein [Phycisphaerae bacterium]|nr:FeoB-associated Cys-rich membrane protein [Phycisphaerae bacterium]